MSSKVRLAGLLKFSKFFVVSLGLVSLVFLTMFLSSQPSQSASKTCEPKVVPLKLVKSQDTKNYQIQFGPYQLEMPADGVDPKSSPISLTDGFLIKKDGAKKPGCRGSEGINGEIFSALDYKRLVTFSYSGSTSTVEVIDPKNCKSVSTFSAYTPKMSIDGSTLTVVPACECGDDAQTRCQCDPGGVYNFASDCALNKDEKKSSEQTLKVLGVAFNEESWIAFPSTPKVKFLEKWKRRSK